MSGIGRTRSISLSGLRGEVVHVEADIAQSLPGFTLLGLPDQALQESRDRIRSAARNAGLPLTRRHLTVNLLPAGVHKRGAGHDLAIVLAAYAADGRVRGVEGPVFLAELGLDGALHRSPETVAMVMAAVDAGCSEVVVAEDAEAEALLVPGAEVRGFAHLHDVILAFGGEPEGEAPQRRPVRPADDDGAPGAGPGAPDLAEVAGQAEARFALEVAAAGAHHLLLRGAPGAGKTMLAERLPGILPPLDRRTALECAALRSLRGADALARRGVGQGSAGTRAAGDLDRTPPFEAPHHSASMAALVGGGANLARPGAVSLAHGGVLFLDEAPEFERRALESLRQPLESGEVLLHRARGTVAYPARFQLVLAANPCPCGKGGGNGVECRCSVTERRRYGQRLSGPLLDRVDLQVTVRPVQARQLAGAPAAETSAQVAARVAEAARRQAERWARAAEEGLVAPGLRRNAHAPAGVLRHGPYAVPPAARRAADEAVDHGLLSARGHARVLRLAWTLADLRGAETPAPEDTDVALTLRHQEEDET
ncbi:YifB family Mg chelatase-like AAA ATPase [Micrococcus endophyticus]|uniref:YifB family Mg chelatase-like AAA ATPase n=2 Tax=Micrococcus TaxID=1269 RepID=UPI0034CF4E90